MSQVALLVYEPNRESPERCWNKYALQVILSQILQILRQKNLRATGNPFTDSTEYICCGCSFLFARAFIYTEFLFTQSLIAHFLGIFFIKFFVAHFLGIFFVKFDPL